MKIRKLMFTLLLTVLFAMSIAPAFASDNRSSSSEPTVEYITVDELKTMMESGGQVMIIDARGSDYDESKTKIKGAKHFASGQLEAHIKDLPRDKTIVTYCACITDGGAIKTARTLLSNGFVKVRVLKGGWNAWNQSGGPVDNK